MSVPPILQTICDNCGYILETSPEMLTKSLKSAIYQGAICPKCACVLIFDNSSLQALVYSPQGKNKCKVVTKTKKTWKIINKGKLQT